MCLLAKNKRVRQLQSIEVTNNCKYWGETISKEAGDTDGGDHSIQFTTNGGNNCSL